MSQFKEMLELKIEETKAALRTPEVQTHENRFIAESFMELQHSLEIALYNIQFLEQKSYEV